MGSEYLGPHFLLPDGGFMFDLWVFQLLAASALGAIGWYLRSLFESARRDRERLQGEWRSLYLSLLYPFITAIGSSKNPEQLQKVLNHVDTEEYRHTLYEITLIGSDEVVVAFIDFMRLFWKAEREGENVSTQAIITHWGGLLLAIRKDLGLKNTKLVAEDMLRTHIKDMNS